MAGLCGRTAEQVLEAEHDTSWSAAESCQHSTTQAWAQQEGQTKRGGQEAHLAQGEPGLPVPLEDGEPAEQHADEQQQKVELQQGMGRKFAKASIYQQAEQ